MTVVQICDYAQEVNFILKMGELYGMWFISQWSCYHTHTQKVQKCDLSPFYKVNALQSYFMRLHQAVVVTSEHTHCTVSVPSQKAHSTGTGERCSRGQNVGSRERGEGTGQQVVSASGLYHRGTRHATRAPSWGTPEQAMFRDMRGQPTLRTSSADCKAPTSEKASSDRVLPQHMVAMRAAALERLGKLSRKDLRQPSRDLKC